MGNGDMGLGVISYGDGRYGHTGTIENHPRDGPRSVATESRGPSLSPGPTRTDTPRLESIINRAFEAAGFISG